MDILEENSLGIVKDVFKVQLNFKVKCFEINTFQSDFQKKYWKCFWWSNIMKLSNIWDNIPAFPPPKKKSFDW